MTSSAREALNRLRGAGSRTNVEGMARFGIRTAKAYGVPTPVIRAIARQLKPNTKLALELWPTRVLEARILAAMIADPAEVTEAQVERWVGDFDNWGVCDGTCLSLLWRMPFAWRKVEEWSRREPEFERRAAFSLLAVLAVHDKKAPDKQFRAALKLVWQARNDERNYVRKAVNWALRQIGKRNATLHAPAMQMAERLARAESRAARWIGHDALRELRHRSFPT